MCGIVGYVGRQQARDIILHGLKELEYRGYDSAGMAVADKEGTYVRKAVGRVENLAEAVNREQPEGTCAIGHTRWATHGGATENNCHPHQSGRVTLIHNGIIENYKELAGILANEGRTPVSETDSEILAMFLDARYDGDPIKTMRECLPEVEGSYAICVLFADHPDEIYIARLGSPLIYGTTSDGAYVASDIVAILAYTDTYSVLPEGAVARLRTDEVRVITFNGRNIKPPVETVSWNVESAKKDGYEYYMLKEIHEEYDALQATLRPRIIHALPDFSADNVEDEFFKQVDRIVISACGTALHAGMVGSHLLEQLLRIETRVEIASEFRYGNPILDERTLLIVISQSGETADTLAALRLANERGAKTLAIVNVKGSAIAREAQRVLYTHAGPEIAVASTKAYAVQMGLIYLIALRFGLVTCRLDEPTVAHQITRLMETVDLIPDILAREKEIEAVAKELIHEEHLFFIGRGIDYALSLEGSLKLKEISYIHSEAYAAGELKHGTISLISEGMPVIAICSQDRLIPKMISNIREVESRGAKVIFITNEDYTGDEGKSQWRINIPKTDAFYTAIPVSIILQLIAYYVSYHKGLDVDHPRNLAKSVTVE
ncbi:MAG: glutamine--fructose-6-phosphate transaminase (isomerizing) [Eubacteriales bacterium]|nr:glutamine--fructose-6-phosphate transaminase (isomerizing) [Eubacteriales bacterium]